MKTMTLSKRLLISAAFIASIGFASYYFFSTKLSIYNYNEQRDAAFILDIFQKNWYWLVAQGSDFSPEHMLRYQASSKDRIGDQTIKVLYKGNNPVGFVAYHPESDHECKLHFLFINEEYRSKGYGLLLVNHALKELLSQGCTTIKLATRVNNYAAQTVYKKAGFRETTQIRGFVYFEYKKQP